MPGSLILTAVLKDWMSWEYGLAFCGARTYSITEPSTLPTWLTNDASTGLITMNPTDIALGGT